MEIRPGTVLLPADPVGWARVRSLALFRAAHPHPQTVVRLRSYLAEKLGTATQSPFDPSALASSRFAFHQPPPSAANSATVS